MGQRGPVRFQRREAFSLQVVSGLRLPQGASCDLGSRCQPVGTYEMLGLSVVGRAAVQLAQKWVTCRMEVKQGSTESQTLVLFFFFLPVSIWVEFSWDGEGFVANGHACAVSPERR